MEASVGGSGREHDARAGEGDGDAAPSELAALARDLRTSVTVLRLLVDGVRDGVVDPAPGSTDLERMLHHVGQVSRLVIALGELDDGPSAGRAPRAVRPAPGRDRGDDPPLTPARPGG